MDDPKKGAKKLLDAATANSVAALNAVILPVVSRMMQTHVHRPSPRPDHEHFPHRFYMATPKETMLTSASPEELQKWENIILWLERQTKGEYFFDFRWFYDDVPPNDGEPRLQPPGKGLTRFLETKKFSEMHYAEVYFASYRDAVLFKMFFYDYCTKTIDIARSEMYAMDIVGVQPMTGPTAQIHSLRVRYSDVAPPESSNEQSEKDRLAAMLGKQIDGENNAKKRAIMEEILANAKKELGKDTDFSPFPIPRIMTRPKPDES